MLEVRTVDYHTAGEPFRIVLSGVPDIPGGSVRDRREYAAGHGEIDVVRRLLCHEPRGHADMYGCFLVPADDDGAHLGVLFWHKDGYSTACGHGTIALGAWAVQSGLVPSQPDGVAEVVLDVPSGRVTARVERVGGAIRSVVFRNVASYPIARGIPVDTSRGRLNVDLAYGGAIYATMPASSAGLQVRPQDYPELIAVGRQVKRTLNDSELARHPDDDRLSGVYGTILYDDLDDLDGGPHQRNVTVFADGEVDRSPCGSGTAARVAQLVQEGRLVEGQVLTHDSIVGSRFLAWVAERASTRPDAVIAEVSGMAYRTGEHRFVLEGTDPLGTGFVLR